MKSPSQSLTVRANGRLAVLQTECHVTQVVDPSTPNALRHTFQAIWDTGATMSCITQNVVDRCGLQPTGMVQVHGVGGMHTTETYLVAMFLPNQVCFSPLRVTRGNLGGNADILIGMDIIGSGDFSVTNVNGETVFSYRFPSMAHVDYVAEHLEAEKLEAAKLSRPPANTWHRKAKKRR